MNIFALSNDPQICAKLHIDKHVCKMIVETAQMLCTTHHIISKSSDIPYKSTHVNHPCTKWVRESIGNYLWTCDLGLELCKEYTRRYGKIHKSQVVIEWCEERIPNIDKIKRTPFAQAMPEEFKHKDSIQAYKLYYKHKRKLLGIDK